MSQPSAFATLKRQLTSLVFVVLFVIPLALLYREFFQDDKAGSIKVHQAQYQGWKGAVFLTSETAEVVVVPEIGRVMQFHFKNSEGPFFENADLFGKTANPLASDWANFGGDKAWPSPQSDWPSWTPRAWPPPPAFDSSPVAAELRPDGVVLHSPVDPFFNIRVDRTIRLDPSLPEMTIVTRFEKVPAATNQPVTGLTNAVGIWVVTQLKDPVAVFIPVPKNSIFPEGYNRQSDTLPSGLKPSGDLIALTRDPTGAHKIGSDASSLVWVGSNVCVHIECPRVQSSPYPDQGSSAEVYTNPDPLAYVELEMLGPVRVMNPGDVQYQTNRYTLYKRSNLAPEEEARRILHR